MNLPVAETSEAFLAGLTVGIAICFAVDQLVRARVRKVAARAKAAAPAPPPQQRQLPTQEVIGPAPARVPIIVPRPTWFQIDPIDDRTITIELTMTKGEVAAASIELHAIGHRPAMSGFRNALQMAAKAMK